MEYKIIQTYKDKDKFEKEVNAALQAGWKLSGGVSVCGQGEYTTHHQAVYLQGLKIPIG
jgi:hypothetical protein